MFSVLVPKPRAEGRGSPVETSAKQKRRPSRQARPSPSAPARIKALKLCSFKAFPFLLQKIKLIYIIEKRVLMNETITVNKLTFESVVLSVTSKESMISSVSVR